MKISFSRFLKYLTCGFAMDLHYNQKLRPVAQAANLVFGDALHTGVTTYVAKHALGQWLDPVELFRERFASLNRQPVEYKSTSSPREMEEMGMRICQQFPDYWEALGLIALLDSQGTPWVERELDVPLPGGHILVLRPDIVAMNIRNGSAVIIDVKSAARPHDPVFGALSQQLDVYQYGVEASPAIDIGRVDAVGFLEAIKRKADGRIGPSLEPFVPYPRRPDTQIEHTLRYFSWAIQQIEAEAFFRTPMSAFNSPCSMCEYAQYCTTGRMEGLRQLAHAA